MKHDVRRKKYKLLSNTEGLQEIIDKCGNHEIATRLKEQYEKVYNKWNFYDKLIKTMEKDDEGKKKSEEDI